MQASEMEAAAYYAVVKALTASNRFDSMDGRVESLLDTLGSLLGLSEDAQAHYMEHAAQDAEAMELARYAAPNAAAASTSMMGAMPMQTRMPMAHHAQQMQQPQHMHMAPQGSYDMGPYAPQARPVQATTVKTASVSKKPKPSQAAQGIAPPMVAPGGSRPPPIQTPNSSKAGGGQKQKLGIKSAGSTPMSTPTQPIAKASKGPSTAPRERQKSITLPAAVPAAAVAGTVSPRPIVGAAATSAEAAKERKLWQEVEELNQSERAIFTELLAMGVTEEDPELNDVHRRLLEWYRLNAQHEDMERELDEPLSMPQPQPRAEHLVAY